MRLVGLALLTVLFLATAVVLSRLDVWATGLNFFDDSPVSFESRTSLENKVRGKNVEFRRAAPGGVIILSGLPSYASMEFMMPFDARPVAGDLEVVFTSQVFNNVDSVLRVTINGEKRGEMMLRAGRTKNRMQVELRRRELSADALNVTFSIHGQGDAAMCSPRDVIEAVVEIEPETLLRLDLDKPLEWSRDKIAAFGNTIPIGWTADLTPEEQLSRLLLGARLRREHNDVQFLDAGGDRVVAPADLEDLLHDAGDMYRDVHRMPLSIALNNANDGAKVFRNSMVWRYNYDVRDFEGERVPTHLDLSMWLGLLPASATRSTEIINGSGRPETRLATPEWLITVLLNEHIIFQQKTSIQGGEYKVPIDLPAEHFKILNQIEVRVSHDYYSTDPCDRGPELMAEMTRASVLRGIGPRLENDFNDIRRRIMDAGKAGVLVDGKLSSADAEFAAAMLSALVPDLLEPQGDDTEIMIYVISRLNLAELRRSVASVPGREYWLISGRRDDLLGSFTRPLSEASQDLFIGTEPMAILVSLPVYEDPADRLR